MDVALIFHQQQRELPLPLGRPAPEVPVEFVGEELLEVVPPVGFLHQGDGRVVGQALGKPGRPLHVGADHLVAPPLVADLVGRHVKRHVEVVVATVVAEDEPDTLRIGHRVRKRLGKPGVPGELENPDLAELVRAEMSPEVVERRLHRGHHPVEVVLVTGVIVDLELDALELVALHRVAGGEERVEVGHRPVHRVFEDPTPVFLILFHEIAGGDRDLVGRRAHRGLEVDPVGVVGEVAVGPGRFVVDRRHPGLGGQPLLPAIVVIADLAPVLIAEQREVFGIDEGAVRGDHRGRPAIGEAARGEPGPVAEMDGIARSERGRQPVDPGAEGAIRDQCRDRPVPCQRVDPELWMGDRDPQRIEWPGVLVHEGEGPARPEGQMLGLEVGSNIGGHEPGQVEFPEFFVGLLVGALLDPALLRVPVVIEDVGVVEDHPAAAEGEHQAARRDRPGRSVPAEPRHAATKTPSGFGPANPKEEGQNAEEHRGARPVERGPEQVRDVGPESVHVGVDEIRRVGIGEQLVLDPERPDRHPADPEEDHHHVADVFLIDQHVHEEREHGDLDHRRQCGAEQVAEIEPEFVVVIALGRLDDDPGRDHDEEQKSLDQHQPGELAEERHAGPGRERVGDLVQLELAFPPNGFPGIDGDQDDEEQEELVLQHLSHGVGHRPGLLAIENVEVRRRHQHVDYADRHDRQERHLAHDTPEREPGGADHLLAPGRTVEPLRRPRRRGDRSGLGFSRRALLPADRDRRAPESERRERDSDDHDGHREPDQPVFQHHPAERHGQPVLLGDGPVSGQERERLNAERIG